MIRIFDTVADFRKKPESSGNAVKIAYTELVPEITQEPDYDKALAAVK